MGRTCKNMFLGTYGQQRPRSDCASAQSDQDLPCPLTESLDTTEFLMESKGPDETFQQAQDDVKPHFVHAQGKFFA